jgi:uncharacterized protein YraI
MKRLSLALIAALFVMFGAAADAGNAYTQGEVHLRAGPSTDYPIVMSIPPSSLLTVNGCLDDFTWCDVDWEGNHGWLYGSYLYYDYQQRRVPVIDVGAALGIGIVAFNLGDYWGRYYGGRPWYARRSYWINRPPPPRRPPLRPRPPFIPGRPPHGGPGGPPPPRPARPSPPRPTPSPRPDRPSNPGTPGRPGGAGRPGGSSGAGRPGGAGNPGAARPTPRPSTKPAPRPSTKPAPRPSTTTPVGRGRAGCSVRDATRPWCRAST